MWTFLMIAMLFLFLLLQIFRRISPRTSGGKTTTCPEINILTLGIFYMPMFLIKGLVPAILSARKAYGATFCLIIPCIKRRIFFITGSHGRHAISRNVDLRLPAGQVAQVFGLSEQIVEMFVNSEYVHEIGSIFQGVELKNMTGRHFSNLQRTIQECLVSGQTWTDTGLYDLCSTLVYESITSTLYGSSVNARSLAKELKILDTDVHLLAYPSPFRWFKPHLIRSRNTIAERLSSADVTDSENIFVSKINELASMVSKKDIGFVKMAILWASYGNTIPALFWTYFYLRHYPKVYDLVLREIENISSEMKEDDLIYSLPQLDSVIEETMRLMANALGVRECMRDTQLMIPGAEHAIPLAENDVLVLFPFASQMDEEYFPRPHEFIHDRFLTNSPNEASATARRAHAPFGEGKFICPGRHLGKNIIKLTIVALLTQFDIEFFDPVETMKTPAMLKSRHGFGVPPPEKDLRIRYRLKS